MINDVVIPKGPYGEVNLTVGLEKRNEPKAPFLRDGVCVFPRKEFESLKKTISESFHLKKNNGLNFLLSQLHKFGLDFRKGIRESAEIILQHEDGKEERKLINLDLDHFGEELTVEIEPEPPEIPKDI